MQVLLHEEKLTSKFNQTLTKEKLTSKFNQTLTKEKLTSRFNQKLPTRQNKTCAHNDGMRQNYVKREHFFLTEKAFLLHSVF